MLQFPGFYSRWQADKELGAEEEQKKGRQAKGSDGGGVWDGDKEQKHLDWRGRGASCCLLLPRLPCFSSRSFMSLIKPSSWSFHPVFKASIFHVKDTLLSVSLILIHQWHFLIHITIQGFLSLLLFLPIILQWKYFKTSGSWRALASSTFIQHQTFYFMNCDTRKGHQHTCV